MNYINWWSPCITATGKFRKKNKFRKQLLDNTLFLRCDTFKFILVTYGGRIYKTHAKSIVYLLFYITLEKDCSSYMFCSTFFAFDKVDIWDPCSIQNRTHRDKSQRLEAVTNVSKSSISFVAGVLDLPLKSISNSLSSGFGFD